MKMVRELWILFPAFVLLSGMLMLVVVDELTKKAYSDLIFNQPFYSQYDSLNFPTAVKEGSLYERSDGIYLYEREVWKKL